MVGRRTARLPRHPRTICGRLRVGPAGELQPLYKTGTPQGRRALRRSLELLFSGVGSLERFEQDYPVYINDPVHGSLGVFPQLPILDIAAIHPVLYRLFDTDAGVFRSPTNERVSEYIARTGTLPLQPPPASLILRAKPRMYWCSHQHFNTPAEAREALQILPQWNSDLRMRAILPTAGLDGLVFVAYSGVTEYPSYVVNLSPYGSTFAGYNVELQASDHPDLPGGGLQVGVVGEPPVSRLEHWNDAHNQWEAVWTR